MRARRKTFTNWVRNHYHEENTMRFVFSDEKCSISTMSIMHKMRVRGREETTTEVSPKVHGFVSRLLGGCFSTCSF